MKTSYSLVLLLLFPISLFAQWIPQSTGITNNLRGIFVLNESTGFAVGEAFPPNFAPILKTTDGGAHWIQKSSNTANALRDIAFNTNSKGFACGMYGTLLKSTDGGESWGTVPIGTTASLRAIDFPSKEIGYVAGEAGVFLKTVDVGVFWDSLNTGFTQDLLDIEFLNNDTGFSTGSTGFSNGIILRTLDGGASWQSVYTSTQAIPALAVSEDNVIFAGGGTSPNGGHEFIVRSSDGGDTWEEVFTGPPGFSIRRGTFSSTIAGWFVDDAGSVIRTKDGGNTWSVNDVSTTGLNGIFFTAQDTGYVVGALGSIFKYIPCSDTITPLGNITGESNLCFGTTTTYSVAPVTGANSYEWQVPSDATVVFSQGDTLVAVTFGAESGNVTVIAGADCDTSIASFPVIIIPPLQADSSISGAANYCYGDTGIYFIPHIQNAVTYTWSVPSDATILSQNDTMIMVALGTSSGIIKVTVAGNCDTLILSLPITAHTSLPPVSGITGITSVCLTGVASYQISAVPDAFSYDWTLPEGASIIYSQADTLIVIQFDSTSGNIGVTANGYCDSVSTHLFVEVLGEFLPIDTIYGSVTACEGDPVSYFIPPVSGATDYVWSVPDDASILSGQGDTMVVVAFGSSSGFVAITAGTIDCDAAVASLFVNVTASLNQPGDIIGVNALCSGDTGEYIISSVAGAVSYSWTIPAGATLISNLGDTLILVIFGDISGDVVFSAASTCDTVSSSLYVMIHPGVPPIQGIIGDTIVCSGDTATYSIGAVEGVDYSWTVPFDANIISSQGDTVITVLFGNSSDGITVVAGSACALQDTTLIVNVITISPIEAITGDVNVCSGDTATYSIGAEPGVQYSWTVPAGATVVASQGDTTITVLFGNNAGEISVTAESPCGIQDTSLFVNVMPFAPIQNIVGDTLVCSGDTAVYSIGAVEGVNYLWTIPGDASILSSQGDTTITVLFGNESGAITVVMESDCNAHDTTLTVVVVAYPPVPVITFVNNDLISSASAGNQWYYNGASIAGATAQIYTPSLNGTYSVIVTYPPGCATASENFEVTAIGLLIIPSFIEIIVSPNPFETYTTLQLANNYQLHNGKLLIQDIQGKVVVTQDHLNGNTIPIFRDALPGGIYYFRLTDAMHNLMATGKLIIQ